MACGCSPLQPRLWPFISCNDVLVQCTSTWVVFHAEFPQDTSFSSMHQTHYSPFASENTIPYNSQSPVWDLWAGWSRESMIFDSSNVIQVFFLFFFLAHGNISCVHKFMKESLAYCCVVTGHTVHSVLGGKSVGLKRQWCRLLGAHRLYYLLCLFGSWQDAAQGALISLPPLFSPSSLDFIVRAQLLCEALGFSVRLQHRNCQSLSRFPFT